MWSDGALNIVELSEFSRICLDQLSSKEWVGGWWFVYILTCSRNWFSWESPLIKQMSWVYTPGKEAFILPGLCWPAHSGLNWSIALGEFPQACSYSGVSGSLRTSRWLGDSGGLWSQTELGVNSGSIIFLTCSFINFILRQTWLNIHSQHVLCSVLGIAILGCRYFRIPILGMRKLEKQQGSDRVRSLTQVCLPANKNKKYFKYIRSVQKVSNYVLWKIEAFIEKDTKNIIHRTVMPQSSSK